jgi:hypothetical protein
MHSEGNQWITKGGSMGHQRGQQRPVRGAIRRSSEDHQRLIRGSSEGHQRGYLCRHVERLELEGFTRIRELKQHTRQCLQVHEGLAAAAAAAAAALGALAFGIALALAATAWIKDEERYRRWVVIPGSTAIALAGVYWAVSRTF